MGGTAQVVAVGTVGGRRYRESMVTQAMKMTLPDGRTLTWVRRPVEAGGGHLLYRLDTDGSIDGEPISDEKLARLIGLRS